MARLDNGILGEVSGKIGNLTFRKMNGKNFVSVRPKHYYVTKKKEEVASKRRFTVLVKFAKYVNSIPLLSELWKHTDVPGTNSYAPRKSVNMR